MSNDLTLIGLRLKDGLDVKFGPYVQPACLPESVTVSVKFLSCETLRWRKTSDCCLIIGP